ncbi:hypothetical protein ABNC50_13695 [Paenibacillus larvae]|uniref:Stage II sporulation protein M n=3 Tax=Paenibacillus larvae TaxID=1464 RepID=A0AAP5N3G0_9BACL|nr:hypothetical protein [Paenibacillus larvae]MDT2251910.1 hypothetical protein [Paenibacillus larvae]
MKRGVRMTQPKSKIFLVYYMIFCISVVGIGVYLASVLDTDLFGANPPALQNEFMYLFLSHNIKNFVMYLLAFPISLFLQLFDFGGSAFQIAMSYRIQGPDATISRLIPHGLLEFPNMLFYQGMSQYVLFLGLMKKMIPLYVLSIIVLIIAAMLEGHF